jgi:hypothetical protein
VSENDLPQSFFTMSREQFDRLNILSEMYAASSFNSAKRQMSKADFFIIMLKGVELGLSPTTAVDFISVINGKPCLDGKGMLALIYRSPQIEAVEIDSQEEYCAVTIKRRGMEAHTEKFTIEDARKMRVFESGNWISLAERHAWKTMTRTMLKWRAVAAAARAYCPDIIGGLYTPEEMGDAAASDAAALPLPAAALPLPAADTSASSVTVTSAPAWYETDALDRLVERSRARDYITPDQGADDLLALLGEGVTWSDFASVTEAAEAIKAAVGRAKRAEAGAEDMQM